MAGGPFIGLAGVPTRFVSGLGFRPFVASMVCRHEKVLACSVWTEQRLVRTC